MSDIERDMRRSETCEVFTPPETVRHMLDKLPIELFDNPEKTFLDNSCGNGNMLVEVLMKKLMHAPRSKRGYGSLPPCKILPFFVFAEYVDMCVMSLYGTDMMEDNVEECKKRILDIAWECVHKMGVSTLWYLDNWKKALDRQIVCTKMEDWDYERWCPVYEKLF